MPGGQERILKRRIKSVDSTKKMTRAMELIAATRVVKAQERANAARPYAHLITNVIFDLVREGAALRHPLLQEHPEAKNSAFIVISSDRGLCGAYNNTIIRMAEREVQHARAEGNDYSLILIGKKAANYFRFRNYDITAAFEDMTDRPTYEDARQISQVIRGPFEEGKFSSVDLIYTRFVSIGNQRPVVRQFLPLKAEEEEGAEEEPGGSIEYEPNPTVILDELLPRYLESRIFSALLDASASEHASRQRAMKAATDNAEELKTTLTRLMNRARQDTITTEIMEIVGGAEALKQGKGSSEDLLPDYLLPRDLFPHMEGPHDHHSVTQGT